MPECDYCGESFGDEGGYLTHLGDEHSDELGRIDRRRVKQHQSDDSHIDLDPGPVVLVGIILVAGAFVTYLSVFSDQGQQAGPTHIHGTITMTIDGEQVPAPQQQGSAVFHFHGDSQQWHVETAAVSLKQAMNTVGVEISQERVIYDGTTYRKADPDTTITYKVNGQQVVPGGYVLKDGDEIRIIIDTANGS
jgi:hypothetical protein